MSTVTIDGKHHEVSERMKEMVELLLMCAESLDAIKVGGIEIRFQGRKVSAPIVSQLLSRD